MRQHKILTRSLLILSIINFALAAPVAVRERSEVRLDADVTRNVPAASQKRRDPASDEGEIPLPNLPRMLSSLPPSPDLQPIILEMPKSNSVLPPATPDIPGSSTGPRLPMGSPQAGYLLPTPGSWSPNVPGSIHVPPQHLHTADLSGPRAGSLPPPMLMPLPPPPRPVPVPGSLPPPKSMLLPPPRRPMPAPGSLPPLKSMPLPPPPRPMPAPDSLPPPKPMPLPPPPGSLPPPPLPQSHPGQPGPSRVRPPGFSVKPGTMWSTGNQPIPPQRPGVDPETYSQVNLGHQDDFNEVLKNLKKLKIRPRMSDPNTVDLAEKDARSEYSVLDVLPRFKCYGL